MAGAAILIELLYYVLLLHGHDSTSSKEQMAIYATNDTDTEDMGGAARGGGVK